MILAAGAAIALIPATIWAMSKRARRPPLRTGREDDLAEAEASGLIVLPRRAPTSPIDRSAPIHDLDPIEGRTLRDGSIDARLTDGSGDRPEEKGRVDSVDWRTLDDEADRSADQARREWR